MFYAQAREEDGSGGDYIVFGMVLFLWEHVPAWSVVLFFRAQRLNQNLFIKLTKFGLVRHHDWVRPQHIHSYTPAEWTCNGHCSSALHMQ
ncbi:Integral membrane protein GPR137C [Cricetulus griseus]|uniref:Integral membrane protein GPR137C n=1 Tax=Cricetulus griseus TaxID=10029 RepID=G3I6I3_CRIGR|nr:Integral membrane protein GPR137C [Cricetulus griseus]